ncbi:AAA family ATPase [Rhizobium sp. L1K21]|uniref:AAA family ATPase n=1 Tax=Rhizobium sp. L1K21 TaxID=2954933 RepID=UPI002093936B|nr:AAA family ATPase [Rhizobium sp. L1K21]
MKFNEFNADVRENSTTNNFWDFCYHHRYVQLLLPILGLFGAADFYSAYQDQKWPWVLIGSCIITLLVVILAWKKVSPVELLSHISCRHFYPFLSNITHEEREKFLLNRIGLLNDLENKIISLQKTHLIIIGESGAGKSTLKENFKARNREKKIIELESNSAGFVEVIDAILAKVGKSDNVQAQSLVTEIISNGEANLKSAIDRLVGLLFEEPTILIFDQSERLSPSFQSLSKKDRKRTTELLEKLKESEFCKTIFTIRSDRIDGLISMLGERGFEIFFVEGFDAEDDLGLAERIKIKLNKLQVNDTDTTWILDNLTEKGTINAFIFQLAGYLIESIGIKKIKAIGGRLYSGEKMFLEAYIGSLLDEFGYVQHDHLKSADLENILFCVASFNKRKNSALNIKDLTHISHLPESKCERCIQFLRDKKVFDERDIEDHRLRLVHDLLMDHLMAREPRFLPPEQRIAIEQIVDRSSSEKPAFTSLDYVSPFLNFARRDENGSIDIGLPETLLLWFFAIVYFWRIAFPEQAFNLLLPINDYFSGVYPGIVFPPETATYMFIPTAFTQYIWVSIIYGLNREFFYYLRKTNEIKYLYFFSKLIGPFGALLGFLFSFIPSFFVIPIALPGAILGSIYIFISVKSKSNTAIYKYLSLTGIATIGNMIISLAVVYFLIQTVSHPSNDHVRQHVLTVTFISGLFCYFAYQMRLKQGSILGRTVLTTMYAAGRVKS